MKFIQKLWPKYIYKHQYVYDRRELNRFAKSGYLDFCICEKCGYEVPLHLNWFKNLIVWYSEYYQLGYKVAQCKNGKRISLWEFITMFWDCRAK